MLKIVRGQERADELLSRSFSKGRLAHSYLFAGPSGVGKLTAALELAAAWMCEEEKEGYCGECRNCVRVFGFQHPDVRLTIPELGSTKPEEIASLIKARVDDGVTPLRLAGNIRISIDRIREMGERLSRKAYEDKGHIEIIAYADTMGVEAANALLKTLEEPPDETVIILISSKWSALLPTVRSRSHLVRFRRLDDTTVKDILMQRAHLEEEDSGIIAGTSDGRPGIALLKALNPSETESRYGPEEVLLSITECSSPYSAVVLATGVAGKLKRKGTLELCRSMQTLMHDLRRNAIDKKPVVYPLKALQGFSIDEDTCGHGVEIFRRAEIRITGNGMAGVVLAAAFTGMRKSLTGSGKESLN
ncbi:MAG: hypothetical protein ABFR50_11630 [Candidatus Fermentibacteria bacterium]